MEPKEGHCLDIVFVCPKFLYVNLTVSTAATFLW